MLSRFFIHLSYKGTNFHGWQTQKNAITVQEVLNRALSLLLKENVETMGAGRTDTGVHALNFYAHFDTMHPVSLFDENFVHHLNCIIPQDIAIYEITPVHATAHARFDALSRTYLYRLNQIRNPFMNEFAYFFPKKLDIDAMNEAAVILKEYADFTSFCKLHSDVKTTLCNITEAKWEITANELQFTITADRFLRNMVRAIVGHLLEIGLHKTDKEYFRRLIEQKVRASSGMSVAAHGLYLTSIVYPFSVNQKLFIF